MRANEHYLSKREQQIVELLHRHERLTASELVQLLPDTPSNSSVRTILRILEEKGHVDHDEQGKGFVYFVTEAKTEAAKGALDKVVQTFFRGSIGSAVTALVGDAPRLSASDIDAIQSLIDEARSRAEESK